MIKDQVYKYLYLTYHFLTFFYIYIHHRLNNDGVHFSGDAKLFFDASVLDDKDRAHAVGAIAANDAGADDNGKEVDVG